MIFHRSRIGDEVLYVCGSFWPGAKQGEPPPEHFLLTGEVVCDGPRCECHAIRRDQERDRQAVERTNEAFERHRKEDGP